MIAVAFKMLIGNRASFFGIIFGIFLATLLISQQSAIFFGLLSRSYRMVTDIPAPNIWVIDPVTESDEKIRDIPMKHLDTIRSLPNIEWAIPLSITHLPLVTSSGAFEIGKLYGIDDATLIGAPIHMLEGQVSDLRRQGAVIVDVYSANGILASYLPNGEKVPLKVGDELEINNHYAVVVGICKVTQGFYPQPILFTSDTEFNRFSSFATDRMSFVIARSLSAANVNKVIQEINSHTGLEALTKDDFEMKIVESFLKTGILINFGLSVALGIIIGFSIAGQIFYNMTLENISYYALIKALGGSKKMVLQMISAQALFVGIIGFSLGIVATLLWGYAIKDTTLAFLFPWQLLLFSALVILTICMSTAILSARKVLHVDPKILLGN